MSLFERLFGGEKTVNLIKKQSTTDDSNQGYQEFKKSKHTLRILRSVVYLSAFVFIIIAVGAVFGLLGGVVNVYKDLLANRIYDLEDLRQSFSGPPNPHAVWVDRILGVFVVAGGICWIVERIFTKRFETSVLQALNFESHWKPEELRFERDKVSRELEIRSQAEGNAFVKLQSRLFSLREYSLFENNELKFLTEKFEQLESQPPPQPNTIEGIAQALDEAEAEERALDEVEERVERYREELSQRYSQDEVEQKVEQFRMRILQKIRKTL